MSDLFKHFQDMKDEDLSEEILELAQKYHRADFPNPNRESCPPSEKLLEIAKSDIIPDQNLRQHLLNCSSCFQVFLDTRNELKSLAAKSSDIRSKPIENKSKWQDSFLRLIPIFALFLIVLCLASLIIYNQFDKKETNLAKQINSNKEELNNRKTDIESSTNNSLAENQQIGIDINSNKNSLENIDNLIKTNKSLSEKKNLSNSNAKKSNIGKSNIKTQISINKPDVEIAPKSITLDLSDTSVLRGEKNKKTPINLQSENLNIKVNLIDNSPAGIYEVSLLDEFGHPLTKTIFKESNGKILVFELDLIKESGLARLCIAPKNEIPDCFSIKIN